MLETMLQRAAVTRSDRPTIVHAGVETPPIATEPITVAPYGVA
jgi:hypothetical protein